MANYATCANCGKQFPISDLALIGNAVMQQEDVCSKDCRVDLAIKRAKASGQDEYLAMILAKQEDQ